MGITQQALSHKLRGLRPIHVTELEVIAEYLDVDASTLLDRRAS